MTSTSCLDTSRHRFVRGSSARKSIQVLVYHPTSECVYMRPRLVQTSDGGYVIVARRPYVGLLSCPTKVSEKCRDRRRRYGQTIHTRDQSLPR